MRLSTLLGVAILLVAAPLCWLASMLERFETRRRNP